MEPSRFGPWFFRLGGGVMTGCLFLSFIALALTLAE